MLFKKLTRRWLVNGLGVVIAFLVVIEIAAAFLVRSYYYQQAQNSLYTRAVSLSDVLDLHVDTESFKFEQVGKSYVENFEERHKMEFQTLDATGAILASSTGFLPRTEVPLDFQMATRALAEGEEAWGVWNGKNAVGQSVLALTMLITRSDNTVCGAIRYVVALDNVDKQVTLITSAMIALGLAVLFLILLTSTYFVNSILRPLTAISISAEKVSKGDFSHRIPKQYDDELGDLCDRINDMASQLETSDTLQTEFISSISHELRTPLTAIKGWTETLRESDPADKEFISRGLTVIGHETDRLSGIVEELLDFSRMQKTRYSDVREPIDVFAEIEEAVFLMKDRAEKQGLHLSCVEQESLPPIVGNAARLRQVFVNLIDNAIKYSKENGSIHLDAAPVSTGVQIVISDDGIGISPEDLPYVKERFYRASNTLPGSGIGLAVANEIVMAHGGTLHLDSELGKGTVVTITLPKEM